MEKGFYAASYSSIFKLGELDQSNGRHVHFVSGQLHSWQTIKAT
jgi:hypothetical protein